MSQAMAADSGGREAYPEEHLRQQLAAAVRKMQWSYAIFWRSSIRQQGFLTWSDGYYNGGIKTRKTTQPMEFQDDPLGLQRSEQLRELYVFLSAGDSNQQTREPSALLTPEDLTDTEWYYLVCMSFTFTPGQCLPGRALMNNQYIWLADAQFADNKLFTRSLLAKSASIQTVVCFPFMDGILEFGTTELVLENTASVQQITTSFSEATVSPCSEQSLFSSSLGDKNEDILCANLDHDIVESAILSNYDAAAASQPPMENVHLSFPLNLQYLASNERSNGIEGKANAMHKSKCKEMNVLSSYDSSNKCCPGEENDDSILTEGLNNMSHIQMTDDDFRNNMYGSLSSDNFMSMSFVNPQKLLRHSSPRSVRMKKKITMLSNLQKGNYITSLDLEGDNSHYSKATATVLRRTHQLALVPCFPEVLRKSSFTVWKKDLSFVKHLTCTPQKLLKNVLMYPAQMRGSQKTNVSNENGQQEKVWMSEGDAAGMNHVISERKRRMMLNEKFLVLRTIAPSIRKFDKASVLGDTIEYLKVLEKRVEEFESSRDFMELEVRGRRKHPDVAERTSDNYGSKEVRNEKKPCANKRKVCNMIDDADAKDGHANVNVTVIDREVLIDIHCPWRDCLLMEVVESISILHLDPFSVQSSTVDGIIELTIKSKFMDSIVASPGMIKRALHRVVAKY